MIIFLDYITLGETCGRSGEFFHRWSPCCLPCKCGPGDWILDFRENVDPHFQQPDKCDALVCRPGDPVYRARQRSHSLALCPLGVQLHEVPRGKPPHFHPCRESCWKLIPRGSWVFMLTEPLGSSIRYRRMVTSSWQTWRPSKWSRTSSRVLQGWNIWCTMRPEVSLSWQMGTAMSTYTISLLIRLNRSARYSRHLSQASEVCA